MKNLKNINILITAGPTHEYLDPVRYLTNPSSGEMGFTLAYQLQKAGANVTVISGPTALREFTRGLHIIRVTSAIQMFNETKKKLFKTDVFIGTAAVSDYRPRGLAKHKIKKSKLKSFKLILIQNPDILKMVGEKKKKTGKPLVIGFALETKNVKNEAVKKLKSKNCDLVIGNSPKSFGSSKIKAVWVEREGVAKMFPMMNKNSLAIKIKNWLIKSL